MTDLESLRRVEAMLVGATGPSIALDREIAEAIGLNVHYSPFHEAPMYSEQLEYGPTIWHAIKPYTASIDAALTLVPEGWRLAGLADLEERKWWACVRVIGDKSVDKNKQVDVRNSCSPALALCLASVRAHIALSTTPTMKEQEL